MNQMQITKSTLGKYLTINSPDMSFKKSSTELRVFGTRKLTKTTRSEGSKLI